MTCQHNSNSYSQISRPSIAKSPWQFSAENTACAPKSDQERQRLEICCAIKISSIKPSNRESCSYIYICLCVCCTVCLDVYRCGKDLLWQGHRKANKKVGKNPIKGTNKLYVQNTNYHNKEEPKGGAPCTGDVHKRASTRFYLLQKSSF